MQGRAARNLTVAIKMITIAITVNTSARKGKPGHSPSPVLKTLLGSTTRTKLLSHFSLHPGEEFHVRELERILGEPASNLLRDLRRLRGIKLLETRQIGNQVRYTLNRTHPLYEDLQRLVLKTAAAVTVLAEALRSLKEVELAFVYGSFAKGEADARSDLDLMVIGEVSDRSLAPVVAMAERELGREVSYTQYNRAEAKKKSRQRDSFLHGVLAGPRIVLIGSAEDELFNLAGG